jgi:L-amino acid N-acyltransferase YncA
MPPPTEEIETIDGVSLQVRPIGPSDRDRLADFVARLSDTTRFNRFLGNVTALSERNLQRFTGVDHHADDALVAVAADGEIQGVARYMDLPERPGAAEVAVTIADEWQGRGVGTALLGRLMQRAREEGFELFTASCFASNREMRLLFQELGRDCRVVGGSNGVVEIDIELPDPTDQ